MQAAQAQSKKSKTKETSRGVSDLLKDQIQVYSSLWLCMYM